MAPVEPVAVEKIEAYTPPFEVALYDFSQANLNHETRVQYVTTVASLSYGNEKARDPHKLYELLKRLGHDSVFEFIRQPTCDDCTDAGIQHSLRHVALTHPSTPMAAQDLQRRHRGCIATFKITAPIFVARQIMRHRGFSYLELSRRYVRNTKVPFQFYVPPGLEPPLDQKLSAYLATAVTLYDALIAAGHKPEVARSVLPIGLMTTFWMQGHAPALQNFFLLRLAPAAQAETRAIAAAMARLLVVYQPELAAKVLRDIPETIKGYKEG